MQFAIEQPMVLVPFKSFEQLGHIPRSSEREQIGVVDYETDVVQQGMRKESMIVFISHRWLSPSLDSKKAHPDKDNAKYEIIVEGMKRLLKGLEVKHVFIWIDYCCIDQDDAEKKGSGVASLPGYVERSDVLLTPYTERFAESVVEERTAELLKELAKDLGLLSRFKSLGEYIFERVVPLGNVPRFELSADGRWTEVL